MKISFRLAVALATCAITIAHPSAAASEKSLADVFCSVFAKARTRPVRVLMGGTSIATFGYSNNQIFVNQLKALYGDARADVQAMGVVNGSWDLPSEGWFKQPYSGPSFIRLRGDRASRPLEVTGYGSTITVEYSREADGSTGALDIDDQPAEAINCQGPQELSVKAVYTVPMGVHRVTFRPPAGGYVYLERVIFQQDRPGVEVIDGTLGGSGLIDVYESLPSGGQTIPGIPTQPGVGVRSYFQRPDVDLVIWSGPVNDTGAANPDFATWAAHMDEIVEATRRKSSRILYHAAGPYTVFKTKLPHGLKTGDVVELSEVQRAPALNGWQQVTVVTPTTFTVPIKTLASATGGRMRFPGRPLLLIAEMGGHLAMPTDPSHVGFLQKYEYMKQLARDHRHVYTLDWHGATFDADIERYAATYYTNGTGVNVNPSTGAFSGDFIHPNAAAHRIALKLLCDSMHIPVPVEASAADLLNRIRKSSPVAPGTQLSFFEGSTARSGVASAAGAGVFAGLFTYVGTRPLIVSPETTNLTNHNQAIAASTTSDRFGSYIDYPENSGLPVLDRVNSGERVTITALIKPSVAGTPCGFRSLGNGSDVLYLGKTVLPDTGTFLFDPNEAPFWITFEYVKGSANILLVTGRLYSISVTRTNGQPVTTEAREFNVGADLHTLPAAEVTSTTASLKASALTNSNGPLSISFDIGTRQDLAGAASSLNTLIDADGQAAVVSQTLTGLRPNTTYYFRTRATAPGNPFAQNAETLSFRTTPVARSTSTRFLNNRSEKP